MTTPLIDYTEDHGPLSLALGTGTALSLAGAVVDIGRHQRSELVGAELAKDFAKKFSEGYTDKGMLDSVDNILNKLPSRLKFKNTETIKSIEGLVKNRRLQMQTNKSAKAKLGLAGVGLVATGASILNSLKKEAKKEDEKDSKYVPKAVMGAGAMLGAMGAKDLIKDMSNHRDTGRALNGDFIGATADLAKARKALYDNYTDVVLGAEQRKEVRRGEEIVERLIHEIKEHDANPTFKIRKKTLGNMAGSVGLGASGYLLNQRKKES